jgi:hypothetical protein
MEMNAQSLRWLPAGTACSVLLFDFMRRRSFFSRAWNAYNQIFVISPTEGPESPDSDGGELCPRVRFVRNTRRADLRIWCKDPSRPGTRLLHYESGVQYGSGEDIRLPLATFWQFDVRNPANFRDPLPSVLALNDVTIEIRDGWRRQRASVGTIYRRVRPASAENGPI